MTKKKKDWGAIGTIVGIVLMIGWTVVACYVRIHFLMKYW